MKMGLDPANTVVHTRPTMHWSQMAVLKATPTSQSAGSGPIALSRPLSRPRSAGSSFLPLVDGQAALREGTSVKVAIYVSDLENLFR